MDYYFQALIFTAHVIEITNVLRGTHSRGAGADALRSMLEEFLEPLPLRLRVPEALFY